MRIKTSRMDPPTPWREFDWSAIDDETYDGEKSLIGFGPTEQDAINDLLDQMDQLPPRKIVVGSDDQCAEVIITDQRTLRLIAKVEGYLPARDEEA